MLSPAKARVAIESIGTAMFEVNQLELHHDLPPATYELLVEARRVLATHVSDEWNKSRTMEAGAD